MPATETHPLLTAARALAPLVREAAPEMDRTAALPPAIVEGLARSGFFAAYVPRELGGAEVRPLQLFAGVEALAEVDASVAWNATIAATTGLYLGRVSPAVGRVVLDDGSGTVAGSFGPTGRAFPEDGGYRYNGRWGFASGSDYAAWMTASGLIFRGQEPVRDDAGNIAVRLALLPKDQCTMLDTWHAGGMRATGSHDYTIDGAFVPTDYTFQTDGPSPYAGTLYRIPFITAFGPGLASVFLGIARGAISELVRLAAEKRPTLSRSLLQERPKVQLQVAEAEALVLSARALMVNTLTEVWDTAEAGEQPSFDLRRRNRLAAWHTARACLRAVTLMYEAGGATSAYTSSPLDRAFRDIRVGVQHVAVGDAAQEAVGRALRGLPPGNALI